jgi:poly(3-hydroxybutyrate) depolymerase
MPIVDEGDCQVTRSPYINGCKIDGAGKLLSWIYKLPASLQPGQVQSGSLRPFDQTAYRQSGVFDSMDTTGWLYVPKACEQAGAHCKLHVAFHGCEQGQNFVTGNGQPYGTVFVEQAGYNRWAESANIVVLYPQVVANQQSIPGSAFGYNPKGCWDFWGYTTPPGDAWEFGSGLPFNRRQAPQMRAVKAMIDALLAMP